MTWPEEVRALPQESGPGPPPDSLGTQCQVLSSLGLSALTC